jgi:hypothetical protein
MRVGSVHRFRTAGSMNRGPPGADPNRRRSFAPNRRVDGNSICYPASTRFAAKPPQTSWLSRRSGVCLGLDLSEQLSPKDQRRRSAPDQQRRHHCPPGSPGWRLVTVFDDGSAPLHGKPQGLASLSRPARWGNRQEQVDVDVFASTQEIGPRYTLANRVPVTEIVRARTCSEGK